MTAEEPLIGRTRYVALQHPQYGWNYYVLHKDDCPHVHRRVLHRDFHPWTVITPNIESAIQEVGADEANKANDGSPPSDWVLVAPCLRGPRRNPSVTDPKE